ncbi:DUF3025 domain-containing protein [Variovorax sp. VNK109]|uniref:DUF3025 domain-containing protein n=1 Tax=Variovorax sp. VNK109 TaxID=3400919 RepID=UPI003BFF0A99
MALNDSQTRVRFVSQSLLPADESYEGFIYRTGTVPTRENLHDFFNGVVWLTSPQTKKCINLLQAGEIERHGVGSARGPLRDALTLFDENGAVLHAPPALWNALEAREWKKLFIDLRPLWAEARFTIFGHALLEQLAVSPRKPLTAHVLLSDAPADAPATDAWLAERLADVDWLRTKPFTPLPVLGIPGWCHGNQNFSFYDDSSVFRPRRAPEKQAQQANSADGTA